MRVLVFEIMIVRVNVLCLPYVYVDGAYNTFFAAAVSSLFSSVVGGLIFFSRIYYDVHGSSSSLRRRFHQKLTCAEAETNLRRSSSDVSETVDPVPTYRRQGRPCLVSTSMCLKSP